MEESNERIDVDNDDDNNLITSSSSSSSTSSQSSTNSLCKGFDFEVISHSKLAQFEKEVTDMQNWFRSNFSRKRVWPAGCSTQDQKSTFRKRTKQYDYDHKTDTLFFIRRTKHQGKLSIHISVQCKKYNILINHFTLSM